MGIYESEAAALAGLKSIYGHPYKVEWTERRADGGHLQITGAFKQVVGYSTEHVADYTITEVEVQTAPT